MVGLLQPENVHLLKYHRVDRFEGVTMGNRGCGGGLTAWKGAETAGKSGFREASSQVALTHLCMAIERNYFGVYQANGKIVRADDAIVDMSESQRETIA